MRIFLCLNLGDVDSWLDGGLVIGSLGKFEKLIIQTEFPWEIPMNDSTFMYFSIIHVFLLLDWSLSCQVISPLAENLRRSSSNYELHNTTRCPS